MTKESGERSPLTNALFASRFFHHTSCTHDAVVEGMTGCKDAHKKDVSKDSKPTERKLDGTFKWKVQFRTFSSSSINTAWTSFLFVNK